MITGIGRKATDQHTPCRKFLATPLIQSEHNKQTHTFEPGPFGKLPDDANHYTIQPPSNDDPKTL